MADVDNKLHSEGESGASAGHQDVIERDIDGLPLRDHKKVDLKAILGHAPPVDDEEEDADNNRQVSFQTEEVLIVENDEEEVEDDEENDDMIEDCLVQRQRRSSLRTQHQHCHEPPDSPPGERKAVRFADALGLGLEAIRDLADAEDPPEIPHSALTALRLRRHRRQEGKLILTPKFDQPVVDNTFAVRLERQNVLLESSFVSSRELTVSGVVQVTNVSCEKTVTIRYTTDSWATYRDVPANYVPKSNDGTTDRFVFIVHLPEGFGDEQPEKQERLQFAVAFHAGEETYWDNNGGENYIIDCVIHSRESSISGEPKSPMDADFEPVEESQPID